LNGKAFRTLTNTVIKLNLNACVSQTFTTIFGPSVLVERKLNTTLIMKILLEFCAVLVCILVGLILLRKFDDKRSSSPPPPSRKVTTMADLTISEMVIREIKPLPVDDVDSVDSFELIAQELIQSRATEIKPSSVDDDDNSSD
jgi:hypothetical protein